MTATSQLNADAPRSARFVALQTEARRLGFVVLDYMDADLLAEHLHGLPATEVPAILDALALRSADWGDLVDSDAAQRLIEETAGALRQAPANSCNSTPLLAVA